MDKRIDVRFRKPTRTKGTPFYKQRNYWGGGVIAVSGLLWVGFELLPKTNKVKQLITNKLEDSEALKTRIAHVRYAWSDPIVDHLLHKVREKVAYKNEPEPESVFFKFLQNLRTQPIGFDDDTNE